MMAAESISGRAVAEAVRRACRALQAQCEYLTSLDQAMGDGDLGITMEKLAGALLAYADATPVADIGKFLAGAGMAANRAAPSTMGTLTSIALMRAGKAAMGKSELAPADLAAIFAAADGGIQEKGKATLGDKTVVDALHPASEAFAAAIAAAASPGEAGAKALQAAEEGRDRVTPLRSRIGRASWVGERTEGKLDPGCSALVVVLQGLTR
jgi:dihydroxyacetone kinase-like protein